MFVLRTQNGPMLSDTKKQGDVVLFEGTDWECESFIDELTVQLGKVITKDSFGSAGTKK